MRFLPTKPMQRDDWLVDLRFRGRITGREIYRRVGVSGWRDESTAIIAAMASLKLSPDEPERIIDIRAARRAEIEPRSTSADKYKKWQDFASRYIRT